MREIPEDFKYEYYTREETRARLFAQVKYVAEYIHHNKIPNVILIDKSMRNIHVGLREYWRNAHRDSKAPNFYFMNPRALKNLKAFADSPLGQDDPTLYPDHKKACETRLKDTHHHLMQGATHPILVLDTCIHSGSSMRPVVDVLKSLGFQDIRTGVMSTLHIASECEVDEDSIDLKIPESDVCTGCYPFGYGVALVQDPPSGIISIRANKNPESLKNINQLRTEIKRIVRKYMQSKK